MNRISFDNRLKWNEGRLITGGVQSNQFEFLGGKYGLESFKYCIFVRESIDVCMKFSVGEEVGYLHEKGGGIIQRIEGVHYFIEDEFGFERPFLSSEIVKIHGKNYQMDHYTDKVNDDESLSTANYFVRQELLTGRKRPSEVWEIDLHIEELLDSHVGLSNTEILIKQMTEFRSFLKRAQEKSIPKLVVIHGVGEGVLKNEIRTFLSKKEHVEFYDASYLEYGKGATEIRLYTNQNATD